MLHALLEALFWLLVPQPDPRRRVPWRYRIAWLILAVVLTVLVLLAFGTF
jgi:hypothetical protein